MKVVELERTCPAFPSQWEGKLEDGRMVYIRYRWGWLSIRISNKPTDNVDEAVCGKEVFGVGYGGGYGGEMSELELVGLTMAVVDYSGVKEEK